MSEARRPLNDVLHEARAADSAGQTWTGRALTTTGFEGDLGGADADLAAALDDPQDEATLMRALAQARLLVPIVVIAAEQGSTHPGDEVGDSGESIESMVEKAGMDQPAGLGRPVLASKDMAVVMFTSPEGERGIPVFSSLAALRAWDATARPFPVTSWRAALAAVAERCDVLLLDLGSAHQRVLRASMVWALAQQRDWLPAHTDPVVAKALSRATADEQDVLDCVGEEGDPAAAGNLRVVLRLRAGLSSAQVQALATRVGEAIATDGEARARIDGLAFAVRQA